MQKPSVFRNTMREETRRGRSFFSSLFTATWNSLGSWIGTYDATDPRNTAMRGVIARPISAADLTVATPYIRNLCRNMERNNPTVRSSVEALVANVIGTGIALEPDTGNPEIDEKLRVVWNDYIRDCFIDRVGLYEGQSQAFRDVVVAGESLWRMVIDPAREKDGLIPLCILPLEAEWLGDNGQTVVGQDQGYVGGVKLDEFGRPIAYSLRSPSGTQEDVPARLIIHCFEKRRALQVRGEPWFAPILTTLRQEKDLVMAELEAAKNTAGYAAAITTNGGLPPDLDEKGEKVRDISMGSVLELQHGEDIKLLSHTRPSQQIKPFRDMLRGDECAAMRIGRRWLDRDISQANYSSMRADMLDNERLLGPVREWTGRPLAGRVYEAVLPYLCVKAGVPLQPARYRLVPEGQPYVDPEKDARAAAMAIAYGLSTYEAEVGKRGGDYKQVWKKLAEEKKLAESLGLELKDPQGVAMEHDEETGTGEKTDTSSKQKTGDKPKYTSSDSERSKGNMNEREIKAIGEVIAAALSAGRSAQAPAQPLVVRNEQRMVMDEETANLIGAQLAKAVSAASPPVVNVAAPTVTVQAAPAPEVTVNVEPTPVNMTVEASKIDAPVVNVSVPAPVVNIENEIEVPQRTIKAVQQRDGSVLMTPVGED